MAEVLLHIMELKFYFFDRVGNALYHIEMIGGFFGLNASP